MFNFKNIAIVIAIVILTAFAVQRYESHRQFEALKSELMVGDCEHRDGYTVCTTVTDIYVGPPR